MNQLDPFLLPSPTSYRFALLVALVAAVSCILFAMLHNSVQSNWDRRIALGEQCAQIPNPISADGLQDTGAGGLLRDQCMAPANRAQGLSIVAGLALLFAVAFGLYWTAAARKLRSERLEPLSRDDAPDVLAALEELCRVAGLESAPCFVWSPTNATASGVAFGRRGRYYVALTGGLVRLSYTDTPAFRAIVLHELAHLSNRDVDRTYLAVATWQAFLIVALAPLAISRFLVPSEHLFSIAWRLVALTALVLLTRNEVLRTREHYADLRALHWEGAGSALPKLFSGPHASTSRWRTLFDFHPSAQQRRAILDDCSALFRPDFALALATGATATIGIRGGSMLFNNLFVMRFSGWFDGLDPGTTCVCLIVGALTAYVIGSDLWESELLAAHRGGGPSGGVRMGVGLGLGLVIGFWIDVTATVTGTFVQSLLGFGCWVAIALLVCVVITKGFADGAHAWLMLGGRHALLSRARSVSLTAYAALLVLWLTALSYAQFALMSSAETNAGMVDKLGQTQELGTLLPLLPLMLAGFTLITGAVPTLTMVVLGLLPFVIRFGTGDAAARYAPSSIRPMRALGVGLAAGTLPLALGYLGGGVTGLMFAIGPSGLSISLTLASIATAAFVARKAPLLGWLHAATSGLGAGAVTFTALSILDSALNAHGRAEHQVGTGFNVVAWLAIGVGLIAAKRWKSAARPYA